MEPNVLQQELYRTLFMTVHDMQKKIVIHRERRCMKTLQPSEYSVEVTGAEHPSLPKDYRASHRARWRKLATGHIKAWCRHHLTPRLEFGHPCIELTTR